MATVMEALGNAFVIQIGVAFYVIKVSHIVSILLSIQIETYIPSLVDPILYLEHKSKIEFKHKIY